MREVHAKVRLPTKNYVPNQHANATTYKEQRQYLQISVLSHERFMELEQQLGLETCIAYGCLHGPEKPFRCAKQSGNDIGLGAINGR